MPSSSKTTTPTMNAAVAADDAVMASQAAARGTLFTLLLRLVSFACTQITIRTLDPSTLGKANIQLELLLTTILFISREGFRLALTQKVGPENWSVAWLTIPVVTFVSGSTLLWHLLWTGSFSSSSSMEKEGDVDYRLAGVLYCVASWIEGCAEPAVLFFLRKLDVPQRASAEGIATVAKTMATVIGLQLLLHWQVTAFGLAQMMYAITYTLYLYRSASSKPDWKQSLPSRDTFWKQLDWNTCYVTIIFTLQGFFKHLLTEADKIVLATISDSYNQGVYAMGASYGGIAARILLQPLEENARLLWSRLASTSNNGDEIKGQEALEESYTSLVKLVLYIGLVFSCIAVHYTNLLLNLLAGRTWGENAEAANVLAAFCVYTAFLALNGMTEALVYAVSGTKNKNFNMAAEMTTLSMVHTFTGLAFAISASILVGRYGTLGLVAANCVAMSIRSLYSLSFAGRYFVTSTASLLSKLSPHPAILTSFAAAWLATKWSLQSLIKKDHHLQLDIQNNDWLLLTGQHLAVGVSCAIGIASLVVALERPFLKSLSGMVRRRESQRPKQD